MTGVEFGPSTSRSDVSSFRVATIGFPISKSTPGVVSRASTVVVDAMSGEIRRTLGSSASGLGVNCSVTPSRSATNSLSSNVFSPVRAKYCILLGAVLSVRFADCPMTVFIWKLHRTIVSGFFLRISRGS